MSNATQIRRALHAAGFMPLPCIGKAPPIVEWSRLKPTLEMIGDWERTYPRATNTGILTRFAPALDIDLLNQAAADEVEQMVRSTLEKEGGVILVRSGRKPKRLIPFRAGQPFKKKQIAFDGGEKLEFLGDGQQYIADGIHPDLKTPYEWSGKALWQLDYFELPLVDDSLATTLFQAAIAIAEKHGYRRTSEKERSGPKANGADHVRTVDAATWSWCRRALDDEIRIATNAGVRNHQLNKSAFALGQLAHYGCFTEDEVRAALRGACRVNGVLGEDGEKQFNASFDSGWGDGVAEPRFKEEGANGRAHGPDTDEASRKEEKAAGSAQAEGEQHTDNTGDESLGFVDVSSWEGIPIPEREWYVKDRIPAKNVMLLSGEGGTGKTLLAQQLAVATVLQRDWFGIVPSPGPVMMFCCEDVLDELHRRFDRIADWYGATFSAMRGLYVTSRVGAKDGCILGAPDRSGLIQPTDIYQRLFADALRIKPANLVIDNSADVYAGNENDRAQVRQFVTLLRRLAVEANCAVTLTSHPSLTGIATGTGMSGSTSWHNSVRSRMFFYTPKPEDKDEPPDREARILEVKKSNYGPAGEAIAMVWKDGLFVPTGVASANWLDKRAAANAADEMFLTLLREFEGQGRNVGHTHTSPNFAPTLFARDPKAKAIGIKQPALVDAMSRLFAAKKIFVEEYGRPSRRCSRIAIRTP